jgi:hypothetical protein
MKVHLDAPLTWKDCLYLCGTSDRSPSPAPFLSSRNVLIHYLARPLVGPGSRSRADVLKECFWPEADYTSRCSVNIGSGNASRSQFGVPFWGPILDQNPI